MPAAQLVTSEETYTFLAFKILEGGWPSKQPMVVEEEIVSPGVSGRRWRTMYEQHPSITVETVSEANNWLVAEDVATAMRKAKGELGTLTITVDSQAYRFKDVHISDVAPVMRIGAIIGGGALANMNAHVVTRWTFELTEFDPSDTE